jgi:hypothetical protein
MGAKGRVGDAPGATAVVAARSQCTKCAGPQKSAGRIIIGTTTDAFFSLDRLARFLIAAPLDLTLALNLDGGPVACQGIALNGYARKTYGRWEARVEGDRVQLLTWPYGTVDMPLVLAVFPK